MNLNWSFKRRGNKTSVGGSMDIFWNNTVNLCDDADTFYMRLFLVLVHH